MDAPPASAPPARPSSTPEGAWLAVWVLTAMNLLNYLDRYVPSAVKDLFQPELHLSNAETSYPLTAFVLVYMIASPVFGSLADRWPRKVLIAGGVAMWSLATGAAAFATGFVTFLLARALVGVGEAAYATLSPALLSDFFAPHRRNRILTIFYMAIPIGSALGFTLGGVLGQHFGWRPAFLMCGLPGLLAAGLVLLVKDPGRGTFDADAHVPPPRWPAALKSLGRNREYVLAVAGYTAVTFASGALADWFPAFLSRYRGMSVQGAGTLVGLSAVVGGFGGTIIGGLLGDRLRGQTRHPYLALSAVSMGVAALMATFAVVAHGTFVVAVCMVATQFFLWFYNAPINAVLLNCVPSGLRPRAFALSILSIHILGDAISPSIVGLTSDATGSLPLALGMAPVTMALGAVIWAVAWRRLPVK
jgi:MFS transporter, Spinster family, sphingosine-1-phosphate transporter